MQHLAYGMLPYQRSDQFKRGQIRGVVGIIVHELLNKLAQMDGFILVARAFENDQVVHPAGSVDPERDIRTMEGEFILNDLVACEKKLERLSDERRKGGGRDKALIDREIELFGRLRGTLEEEKPLRGLTLTADEEKTISGYGLLSRKPVLILVNLDETQPVPVISYHAFDPELLNCIVKDETSMQKFEKILLKA